MTEGTGGIDHIPPALRFERRRIFLKYRPNPKKIPLPQRKAYNEKCLAALGSEMPELSLEEIYQQYTGIGGLHGLHYVDYANYHDFSEAKKEIEQG